MTSEVLAAGDDEPSSATPAPAIDFDRDIRPILAGHCFKCHGPKRQESGLKLSARKTALDGGDSGEKAIVPGKPEESRLIKVVSGTDPEFSMPPKDADKPLFRLLAERYGDGTPDPDVFVSAAGGYYYPGKGVSQLQDEMRRYLDLGYTVLKMKIGGASLAEDRTRIEAVLDVVGDASRLAVDANGRFDLATALAYAEALEPYHLFWYEEAGDPLDYDLQAHLCEAYHGPVATGENLFSLQDARNLIRYGVMRPDCDYIQVDPALGYGLVEYLRILAMLPEHGWSSRRCIPHGGHQFSLHIAAGLHLGGNESYPGVFQPIGGFADGTPVLDGRVRLAEAPGIGIEQKADLYRAFQDIIR